MKVSELASALRELGTAFRHGSKDEPAGCISQLLKLVEGKETLEVSQLVNQAREAKSKSAPRAITATTKKREFDVVHYLAALRNAKTGGEFSAVKQDLQRANVTNDNLRQLLDEYAGYVLKKAKKDILWTALDNAFAAKQRGEIRDRISSTELPI